MDNLASPQHHTFLVLDNIRSVYNVGAIFRTADAAGVTKIYLCGTTPVPIDRFGRTRNDIAKVALGAEETVAYEYFPTTLEAVAALKRANRGIVAVEQDQRSQDFKAFTVTKPTAFVFGDEVGGVATAVLDQADAIVEIPMLGQKESLNVSVTVGIILYQWMVSSG